jgi:hypothetical protein
MYQFFILIIPSAFIWIACRQGSCLHEPFFRLKFYVVQGIVEPLLVLCKGSVRLDHQQLNAGAS